MAADGKARQYVFNGSCNGLRHWVSVLFEPGKNRVTNIVAKAACPEGEPSVSRIISGRSIPVVVGGLFSDRVAYPGISYIVSGRIHSRSKATLALKGPRKTLACTPGAKPASVCDRFTLKAK